MAYVHHVPGRLRISRWAVRHHPEIIAEVQSGLEAINGVHMVRVAPTTGSLIVQYCRRRVPAQQLESWLRDRGHWPEDSAEPASIQRLTGQVGAEVAGKLSRRLFGMMVEKALERLLIAALV